MRKILVLIACVVFGAGVVAAQSGDPLGDVARKKPSGPKAKRVVTDEDMPSTMVVAAPAETPKAAPLPNEAQIATEAITADGEDGKTATPEQKLAAMQLQVSKLKDYEGTLAKHLKQLADKIEVEPSEFRRNMYSEAIQRQTVTLETFKKQRAELESRLSQQRQSKENSNSGSPAESSSQSDEMPAN